jgi:Tfp pilus assembly protein PilP
MRPAITLGLGLLLAAAAPGVHAQANPSTAAGSKAAAQQAAKSAASVGGAAAKPAAQTPAPAAKGNAAPSKAPGKQAAKSPAVARPAKPVEKPVNPDEAKDNEERSARRDPFESLVMRQQAQKNAAVNLPPGKAGLQVGTLRLDGIVKAPNGMIAVVSNPQARTYFLREGDQLYDGRVEKIAMDGVSFHEMGKDAFGKPVEHQVNKRIYSSAGEQQ